MIEASGVEITRKYEAALRPPTVLCPICLPNVLIYEKFDSEINVNRDSGTIRFIAYNKEEGEIMIKTKSGNVKKLSEVYDVSHLSKWSKKYYKILPYKIHF